MGQSRKLLARLALMHRLPLMVGTAECLHRWRSPQLWFRAIFEISTRRTGISGKDHAAHHGLRLLQDGVELAAQAARGDGAIGQ
jgi:hypothetical protein